MPSLIMVPKTTGPRSVGGSAQSISSSSNTSRRPLQQRQPSAASSKQSNTYSLGEESFDSILAMDSPFAKKLNSNLSSSKQQEQEEEEDSFDPFHIGDAVSTANPNRHSSHSSTLAAVDALSTVSDSSRSSFALTTTIPPKMLVKFKVHEEVSSVAWLSSNKATVQEGSSNVYVQGTVQVGRNRTPMICCFCCFAFAQQKNGPFANSLFFLPFFLFFSSFLAGPSRVVGCPEECSLCVEIVDL